MDEFDKLFEIEESIACEIKKIVGYMPTGTRDLLHVLGHPDMLDLTETYIKARREFYGGSL